MTDPIPASRRWLALGVVCLGVLMVVLDVTIVSVALPSIRARTTTPRSRPRNKASERSAR